MSAQVLARAYADGPGKSLRAGPPGVTGARPVGRIPLPALDPALAGLLGEVLAPQRWEPWNSYNDHRAYPSARAAFLVDVAIRAGDGWWPIDAVRVAGNAGGTAAALGSTVHLSLTIHPERLPSGYGRLAEALAELELGHVAAALAQAAPAHGFRATVHATELTLTPGPASRPAKGRTFARSSGLGPLGLSADPRPLPAAALTCLMTAAADFLGLTPRLAHHLAVRNILGTPDGWYTLDSLLPSTAATAATAAGSAAIGSAAVSSAVIGPAAVGSAAIGSVPVASVPVASASVASASAAGGEAMAAVQAAFTYPPSQIDVAGMNVAWVITADLAAAVSDDADYRALLRECGAVGQRLGVAAAEAGLFCRPARSVHEGMIEAAAGVPAAHDFLYALLIGRPRVTGFDYDLSQAEAMS
jgi:hypothetical protein